MSIVSFLSVRFRGGGIPYPHAGLKARCCVQLRNVPCRDSVQVRAASPPCLFHHAPRITTHKYTPKTLKAQGILLYLRMADDKKYITIADWAAKHNKPKRTVEYWVANNYIESAIRKKSIHRKDGTIATRYVRCIPKNAGLPKIRGGPADFAQLTLRQIDKDIDAYGSLTAAWRKKYVELGNVQGLLAHYHNLGGTKLRKGNRQRLGKV